MKKLLFCLSLLLFNIVFISEIYSISIQNTDLGKISGAFNANMLFDSMENQSVDIVFDRLDSSALSILNNSKIWTYYNSYYKQRDLDNSNELFRKRNNLIILGADLNKKSNFILGSYLGLSFKNLEQNNNRAFLSGYSGGFYAIKETFIDKKSVNLKASADFAIQNYEVEKSYLELPSDVFNLADDFSAVLLKTSFVADYIYSAQIRFLAGLDLSVLISKEIIQNNKDAGLIVMESDAKAKIGAILGFASDYKYKKTDLDLKFYLKPILLGDVQTWNIVFMDKGYEAQIESNGENLEAILSAGLKYSLTDKISIRYKNTLSLGNRSFGYGFLISANIEFGKSGASIEYIEKQFQIAQTFFTKREYLRASDALANINSLYRRHIPTLDLQEQIRKIINDNFEDFSKTKIEDNIYAKGYKFYYENNLDEALSEWYRYLQYNNTSDEINEYYSKVQSLLREREEEKKRNSAEAKAKERAEELLQNGIQKFEQGNWSKCIKTMEKLLSFTVENRNLENPGVYRQKAQYYISESLKKLSSISELPQNQKQEEPTAIIDEKGAEDSYREGLSLYSQGKYIEAQRTWELTLRLNPHHKKAAAAISNLKKSGQLTE